MLTITFIMLRIRVNRTLMLSILRRDLSAARRALIMIKRGNHVVTHNSEKKVLRRQITRRRRARTVVLIRVNIRRARTKVITKSRILGRRFKHMSNVMHALSSNLRFNQVIRSMNLTATLRVSIRPFRQVHKLRNRQVTRQRVAMNSYLRLVNNSNTHLQVKRVVLLTSLMRHKLMNRPTQGIRIGHIMCRVFTGVITTLTRRVNMRITTKSRRRRTFQVLNLRALTRLRRRVARHSRIIRVISSIRISSATRFHKTRLRVHVHLKGSTMLLVRHPNRTMSISITTRRGQLRSYRGTFALIIV